MSNLILEAAADAKNKDTFVPPSGQEYFASDEIIETLWMSVLHVSLL